MKKLKLSAAFSLIALLLISFLSCKKTIKENSFGDDVAFLKKYHDVVILKNENSRLLIVPGLQARVMSSTAGGDDGNSYGWVNYDLISSAKYAPHINAFGGEERLWLGPEGGQFGLFFKKGQDFSFANWQTPGVFDTAAFDINSKDETFAVFSKKFELENHSGTRYSIGIQRKISLLDKSSAEKLLGISLPEVQWVGYQSENTIRNEGTQAWETSSGLLSVWLLCMLKSSPQNTILIPYKPEGDSLINDSYFGKVPLERLQRNNGLISFTADAAYRSKIGVPPAAVKPFAGSYDAKRNVLTILSFDFNNDTSYVNSAWEQQADPYKGDVLNAYNDGPNAEGKRLGNFYELESSSPALSLQPGTSFTHRQRIFHFEGDKSKLDKIARKLLGKSIL